MKGVGVFKIFHQGQKCRSNIILHYTTRENLVFNFILFRYKPIPIKKIHFQCTKTASMLPTHKTWS